MFLDADAMRECRANGAFDGWTEAARQAEELAIVFGGTDDSGRRWSIFMEAGAFRAAIENGWPVEFSPQQILVYAPGWPTDWNTERLMAAARQSERMGAGR